MLFPSNPASYTGTAKFLHWLMALLIVVMLGLGWLLEDVPQTLRGTAFMLHKSLGVSLLLLALFRLGWRWAYKAPSLPPSMPRWEHIATKLGHAALYLAMIGMPLSGWAMVSANPRNIPTVLFGLWTWPAIPFLTTLDDREGWTHLFAELHEISALLFALLIAGHVAAALRHHFIARDFILIRMAPRRRAQALLRLRGERVGAGANVTPLNKTN